MIFEQIISFESLYQAHRVARLGKRHKKEVIQFEMNLSENLWKLHYDLKYNKYSIGDYYKFFVYEPKKREIQAISYRDRIVQHSLCDNYLSPLLEKHLIYDNVACRIGKGTFFAIKRIRKFMTKYKKFKKSGYYIKIDIKKYFANISHEILKQKLERLKIPSNILKLTENIINSYNSNERIGIPIGNQTSQSFALLFLSKIDWFIKQNLKVKYYVRYMDDMLLFVENKSIAQKFFNLICDEIKKENLEINPKSQIGKINHGFIFLGWRFFYGKNGKIYQAVKKQTKKRVYARCLKYQKNNNLEINHIVFQSYKGLFKNGNAFMIINKLKQILIKTKKCSV